MATNSPPTIERALISVSDKTGIIEFAQALQSLNIEILSTGGTAKLLQDNNISVIEVSDHTGFPEMMAGRVKTLHPTIHGGLLGRRGTDDQIMFEHGISKIDLLIVNLYPFQKVTANADCDLVTAIENIDIGGPAMLRSAAKNHASVTVVVDSRDYPAVIDEFKQNNTISDQTRFNLALKVFEHTAQYDGAIANYFGKINIETGQQNQFPRTLNMQFKKSQDMRYGENPHQSAALYIEVDNNEPSIANAKQIQGKALSYNNVADSDAALECVKQFDQPACVIVKHANPCGAAIASSTKEAYEFAYQTDPTSAFGGIIAFNRALDEETARAILERQFVEVIIAPGISPAATSICAEKQNVRILKTAMWGHAISGHDYKRINGGLLVQDRDLGVVLANDLKTVSKRSPTQQELNDLLFAWQVAKFVKSNAIVYSKQQRTIGIGAGQMSRVYSAKIAGIKAADENLTVTGSVMASDAFFPFRDGIDAAHEAGIVAVIQPGGSIRDDEVIQAADEHGMAMVFTGMRHFRH